MLIPEASSTCPSVGALAAWASATVGAANAAETADAIRSFFMERPFVGGKDNSTDFYFDFEPAGLLDQPGRIGLPARDVLPVSCPSRPTHLVSLVLYSCEGDKFPELRPGSGARIDQNAVFSNCRMRPP